MLSNQTQPFLLWGDYFQLSFIVYTSDSGGSFAPQRVQNRHVVKHSCGHDRELSGPICNPCHQWRTASLYGTVHPSSEMSRRGEKHGLTFPATTQVHSNHPPSFRPHVGGAQRLTGVNIYILNSLKSSNHRVKPFQ